MTTKPCTPDEPCTTDVPCLVHVDAVTEAYMRTPEFLRWDAEQCAERDLDMAGPAEPEPPEECRHPFGCEHHPEEQGPGAYEQLTGWTR